MNRLREYLQTLVIIGELALVLVLLGAAWRLFNLFGPTSPVK